MSQIEVKKIVKALNASDGAGVKLKRSIGTPEADYIDPFLMLDEFGSENKDDYVAGFPPHPHRGIETVTYMLNGEFEHQDSTGAKGIMTSGDVQWMKTGRGIIHSEMPAMKEGKLLGFQLWINMPAKMKKNKPEYLYIKGNELGEYKDSDKIVKVIAGKDKGKEGTISSVDPKTNKAIVDGINMAIRNNQDGVGLIQTAESGLNEVRNMILRIRELAVQMANGIYEDTPDRNNAQLEVTALLNQIDLISSNTDFNDISLLDGTFSGVNIQAGNTTAETITLSFVDLGQSGLSINGASIATQSSATTVIGTMDSALQTISQEQAKFGSLQNRLNYSISNLSRASVMTEAALGRIMDADFAAESTELSKAQILNQAATSMLAQANQSKNLLLQLIQ